MTFSAAIPEGARRWVRFSTVLLSSLALLACTTLQTVAPDARSAAAAVAGQEQAIKQEDHLVLSLKDGTRVAMRVTAITPTQVSGAVSGQAANVTVPVAQIERIERVEIDTTRVVLLVGLAILAAVIAGNSIGKEAGDRLAPRP